MLKDYHQVTEIIPGKVVTVRTNNGSFEAGKVIITAGPWGPAMVKKLGIELPFKVSETSNKVYSVCEANATLGTEPLIDDVRNHRCSDASLNANFIIPCVSHCIAPAKDG